MKTNFHPKNNRGGSESRRVFIVVGVVVGAILLFSILGGFLNRLASPVWRGESALVSGLSSVTGFFRTKSDLVSENTALKQEVGSLRIRLVSATSDASVKNTLLETFGRMSAEHGVAAAVLVRPPETAYDILLIDAGTHQGVEQNQKVYMPEGPEIGTIVEAGISTARVRLYSSSGEKTNAVLERGGVPVVLIGQGGSDFEFDLPRDSAVEAGDRILSPSLDAHMLGIVRSIQVTPTDAFKKVLIQSVASISSLRFVVVGT